MLVIWILAALAILLALASVPAERARPGFVREKLARPPAEHLPPASVIVPVKDAEPGLRENLEALASLDYPDYELIICARLPENVPPGAVPSRARVVYAPDGDPRNGEKINNLLAAIAAARPESEILAFADSDGRVRPSWLTALATELAQPSTTAATAYRWHVPATPDLPSIARSIWNSVIAGRFIAPDISIAWGGAMAIRRDTFEHIRVVEFWRDSVSDDYELAAAVRASGGRIGFAPGAFVASTDQTTWPEFLGWIKRQLIITRVYSSKLWTLALIAHIVYCTAEVGLLIQTFRGDWRALAVLAVILLLGGWKGARRAESARLLLPEYDGWFRRNRWRYGVLDPVATWTWMYGLAASGVTNTIVWRGVRYRLSRERAERLS